MTTVASLLSEKNPDVWSIAPDASVFSAIELMSEKSIGALPVLENGRLVGVVSERDYARKVILRGRSSASTQVREIMSAPVITVTPDDTVTDCLTLMTERRIRHLPVIEGDSMTGILSIGDLVKQVIAEQRGTIEHLERYISSG